MRNSNKKIRFGLVPLLCTVMVSMLFSSMPVMAAENAGADKGKIDIGTIVSDPFAFDESASSPAKNSKTYPAYYDLRNADLDGDGKGDGVSFITPVKTQNPFGTCWGFSAIAVAESSILGDKELNNDGSGNPIYSTSVKQGEDGLPILDLSEKHLSWFANSALNDPTNPQNGEGIHFFGNDDSAYAHYNTGGFMTYSTLCFASGVGPVSEEAFPYRGKNEEVAKWRVATEYDASGNPLKYVEDMDVWYSDDDDWTLPQSARFLSDFRLKESIILPDLLDETKETLDQNALNAVKEQLADNHRAVVLNFCAESYLPGQDTTDKVYMSSNWAHYTWKESDTNHSVTIVGWDDNYPKENFRHTIKGMDDEEAYNLTTPGGNGAFLIKNSWGSELNEFPNNAYRHWGLLEGQDGIPYENKDAEAPYRSTGYFWISYYDKSVTDLETFVFDRADTSNETYTQQHDYLYAAYLSALGDEQMENSNVFQAKTTSKLSEITVLTMTPDTEVSYEIYLLRGGYEDPTDGIKVTEGTKKFKYGGYHIIDLGSFEGSVLPKDQYYSVIVSETDPSGNQYCPFGYGVNENNPYAREWGCYSKTVVNPGESYLCVGDEWMDLSDPDLQAEIIGDWGAIDNFPIKAVLEPVKIDDTEFYLKASNWAQGSKGTYSFTTGDQALTLTAEFRGAKGTKIPAKISWTSSDSDVFTVEPKEDNPKQAVVTPKEAGIAYLIVDATDDTEGFSYGRRVVGVQVTKPEISMKITGAEDPDDPEFVYTGKEIKPQVEVKGPSGEVLKEGKDYTLSYEDNKDCGTAFVMATGIEGYSGEDLCEFSIVPAEFTAKIVGAKDPDDPKFAYTGKKIKPQVEVKGPSGEVLEEEKDYKLSYERNRKCGTASVTVTGIGNYCGTQTADFTIVPADLTIQIVGAEDPDAPEFVYTGKEIKPQVKVKNSSGIVLTEGKHYTLSYSDNKKCGTASVKATGIGNYSGTQTAKFSIVPTKAKVTGLTVKKDRKLKVTVKNQKATGITGYQISYRVKGGKTWTTKNLTASKNTMVLSKLKAGKKYQVRARGYVKTGGKVSYGVWSDIKTSKKIKK